MEEVEEVGEVEEVHLKGGKSSSHKAEEVEERRALRKYDGVLEAVGEEKGLRKLSFIKPQ